MGRLIDGDELVLWLTKWMMSSFGAEPTEETEAIRKVCDAVGDMVKDLAKDAGGDLISRQAAIDAINCNIVITGRRNSEVVASTIRMFVDRIKALPSAEPKTGRCETCKRNADNGGFYDDGRTRCPIQEHYVLLKDGYCHLYELRMRGEEE